LRQGPGSVAAISGGTAIGTLEYQRRPETACPPVRLAPRPVVLYGREALLADLEARLGGGSGHLGPRVAVLCGMGGAGKTSVALEYAHRLLPDEVGVCWQFAAEDPGVLAAGFGELAAQLGARDLVDVRDPVAAVHAALARSQTGWLLVFDNAADLSSVQAFIPPGGPGRVLVTSQSQHWPSGWSVQVPVLDPPVAASFLTAGSGDTDQATAVELAAELGGLPLALEQAAAYMRATGISLAWYLRMFRVRQADLLARGEAAGHRDHVAATLGLALSRLAKDAPAAAGLMRLLAVLTPNPVPLGPLLAEDDPEHGLRAKTAGSLRSEAARMLGLVLGDPVAVGDAVAALRRYSLVAPAGNGLIHVHRLAQVVTRAQLTDREADEWRQAAAALVEAVIPADAQLPCAWPICALLLPHARAVLSLTSPGIWRVAQSLGYSGNYAAAQDLFVSIAAAHLDSGDYGPEHPVTLAAFYELAFWTGEAGDAAGARDQYYALLPIRERVLGPEHWHTLITRNQLARQTGEAGDVAGARDQLAVLLPVDERVLGAEHPETLTARGNLAYWTGETGDAAGARDQFATLLPVRERISGPEHPETLAARCSLAYWTGEAGDAAGARDQFAVLLPIQERVLGATHPRTLSARCSLAYWTGEAGDAAGARDQFAVLLPLTERVVGPAHPSTLIARASLARWIGRAGDAAGARDQFAALLPLTERVLGPTHPSTLIARASLARSTGEAGDRAGARDQFAVLLPLTERVLGSAHPSTLTARASLAYWTAEPGR
jgi:hypothetical protein